jgi:hypothetical protein
MKTLLRIYSASCIIVLGFFAFFMVPWGILPVSDAVNIMTAGAVLLALVAYYFFYFYRREGMDLGWFLANRGGIWAIAVAVLGLAGLVCGTLLFIWPEMYIPAFEQGALPFGIAIVSLFWLALINMFAYLTFGLTAKTTAYVRLSQFTISLIYALIAIFCLFLAALFLSLYLEVINDIAIRISVPVQWNMIWIFTGLLLAAGIIHGFWKPPLCFLKNEETSNK